MSSSSLPLQQEWSSSSGWTAALACIALAMYALRQSIRKPRLYQIKGNVEMWCGRNLAEHCKLVQEFFTDKGPEYLQHGITLRPGDTVLDVGANYGFFALALLELYENIHVHCFEPIPFTYGNLERNVALWLNRHPSTKSTVQIHRLGLSNAAAKVNFLEDCWAPTGGHSELVDAELMEGITKVGAKAGIFNPSELLCAVFDAFVLINLMSKRTCRRLGTLARVPIVGMMFSYSVLLSYGVFLMFNHFFVSKWVECPLTTVSQFLLQHNDVKRIDLLKVDVEGAEELVLLGIEKPEHWDKIRQVVAEVHDTDGRVARLEQLLKSKGFITKVVQDDMLLFQMINVYSIFAVRK